MFRVFIIRFVAMAALEPYRFEPERAQHPEENDGEDSEDNYRLESTDWCSCALCQVLPTPRECICCREQEDLENKMEGTNVFTLQSS